VAANVVYPKITCSMYRNHLGPLAILALLIVSFGCDSPSSGTPLTSIPAEEWELRQVDIPARDSLVAGSTYLSSYSQIRAQSESHTFSLTGTISLRNISRRDTVYLERATYYGTSGNEVRSYFDKPIFLAPMETIEIIITEEDTEGGFGDNFVFDWYKLPGAQDPFFEGVFISVYGQQGISFTTRGIRLE